jgi:hypothetical protein
MTPEIPSVAEPTPAGLSEFSRITGVFFEPTKTFEDIAARPTWIVPMLLLIVMVILSMVTIGQRIGWERIMRQKLEATPRAEQMTAEQKEQQIAIMTKFASIGGIGGAIVGIPVAMLVESAVLLGIVAGIMSAPVKFKQVLAVVAYSSMVTALVSVPLTIAVVFLKNPDDFNMDNPLAFNPGAFMDPTTTSKFVLSVATSLDLFSFWTIFLTATGLKAAGGKRLSFGGALFAVILPWAAYVLCKSVLAGIFS